MHAFSTRDVTQIDVNIHYIKLTIHFCVTSPVEAETQLRRHKLGCISKTGTEWFKDDTKAQ